MMPGIPLRGYTQTLCLTKNNHDIMKAMQNLIKKEYFKTLTRSNNKNNQIVCTLSYFVKSVLFCFCVLSTRLIDYEYKVIVYNQFNML